VTKNSRRFLAVFLILTTTAALAFADESDTSPNPYPSLGLLAEASSISADDPAPRHVKRKVSAAETVDLNAMDSNPKAPAAGQGQAPNSASMSVHPSSTIAEPHFSIYFDLWAVYEPGKVGFTFENIHPELFLEIVPIPDLMFSFEVNPSPRFFELDYQAAKWVQLRAGKIWIPFDDMNPHSMFGGFIENSRIRLGPTAYLPDIWTDLGVGANFTLMDTGPLKLGADLYVVNGFGNSGQPDPVDSKNSDYPTFADIPITQTDNNTDKAIGGRVFAVIDRKFSIGGSFYSGRWSTDSEPNERITMLGLDSQLQMGKTQFKIGFSYMIVSLFDNTVFHRQGEYAEVNHKFGTKDEWMWLLRCGYLDPDDRVTNTDDTATIGGGLRWKPSLIAFELGYYQDIKYVAAKQGYTLAYFRTVIQL
jgi:hypothetical protein